VEHARSDVKHVLNRKLGCVTHSILTPCHVSESAVVSSSLGSIAGIIITADVPVVAIVYLLVSRYVCLFLCLFVCSFFVASVRMRLCAQHGVMHACESGWVGGWESEWIGGE
jgi:hypothetical protein